jgi:L,D-peptidoglycan transpeptidase YkuD (ErfK/YbiS/YcfS/YnhG family)
MIVTVTADGWAAWLGTGRRCALGRGGLRPDKREGDGATPVGTFPLRRVLWRADRLDRPATALPVAPIARDDGWCDDPADPRYNRPVRLPYPARHEALWRDDALYDLLVVLGHNDDPPVPGLGSAIFLHCARPDYAATEGCIAFDLADLRALVGAAALGDAVHVRPPG